MAAALGLSLPISYAVAIVGNILPVPLIYFFAQKVLLWGAGTKLLKKPCSFFLEKGNKAGKKLLSKTGQSIFVALTLFVGIPLPGTGAWTGTLAASVLNVGFKKSFIAISLGVLLAGVIMMTVSLGVLGAVSVAGE